MRNAREELLVIISDKGKTIEDVIAYTFSKDVNWDKVLITKGTSLTTQELELLDFSYDNSYGSQKFFGTVLFNDGTWLSRGEYDGAEWWESNQTPTIEEVLNAE